MEAPARPPPRPAPRIAPPGPMRLSALAPLQPAPRLKVAPAAAPRPPGPPRSSPPPPTAPPAAKAAPGPARAAPAPPAPAAARAGGANGVNGVNGAKGVNGASVNGAASGKPVEPPGSRAAAAAARPEPLGRVTPPPAAPVPAAPRTPEAPGPASRAPRSAPPVPRPAVEPDFELEADVDAIEVHLRRAPIWRRLVAWLVDLALLGVFLALLLGPVLSRSDLPGDGGLDSILEALTRQHGVLLPALLVAGVTTFAYQWLGLALMGSSPGKRLLRLRVVGPDGRRPSPGRAALRAFLSIPSFLLLGMGPLLGLFTRSGRSLHDFGAGTYLVLAP